LGLIPLSTLPPAPAQPAPSTQPSTPAAPWQDPEIQYIAGILRQIRATCQYLDGGLGRLDDSLNGSTSEIRRAGVLGQAIDRRAELKSGIEVGARYLDEAASALGTSPYLRDWIGDEVTRIQLNWADVVRNVAEVDAAVAKAQANPRDDLPDTLATDVRAGRAAVHVIVLASAAITMPLRLSQHLQGALPGQTISFKSLFEDELPDQVDRKEILRRIAEAPATVDGVVDVEGGTVIAISPSRRRRRQSYLWEMAALLVGGVIAFFAVAFIRNFIAVSNGVHVPDAAAAASLNQLVVLLVVFSAGAGFHLAVDVVKAQQGAVGSPQWAGLDNWLLWLHAREMKVISSIVALWVVFGAVLILAPGGLPDGPTAFFAGYSFDSLFDVVIKRFDAFAPQQIAKATKVVSGDEGTTK